MKSLRSPLAAPAALIALLLGSASPEAQTCATSPQFTLDWEDGVLGSRARCILEGPVGNFVMIPSPQGGPTPLSTFFPTDPRFMCVGLNNNNLWRFGTLAGPGNPVFVDYALPPVLAVAGMIFYGQAATFPGASLFLDQISNPISFVLSLPGQNQPTVGKAVEPRSEHTATRLLDGRVFIAGGKTHTAAGGIGFSSSFEIFDPLTQTFEGDATAAYQLAGGPRRQHTASLLNDGRVLLVGGVDPMGNALATAEVYDPSTASVSPAGQMLAPRVLHSATVLPDGRVLIVGGTTRAGPDPIGFSGAYVSPGVRFFELYSPTSPVNPWNNTGFVLPRPLFGHRASLMPSGKVLITGGIEFFTQPETVASVRIFDPATPNQLMAANPMPKRLAFHNQIATMDGKVLVMGGAAVQFTQGVVTPSLDSFYFEEGPLPDASGEPDMQVWMSGPGHNEEIIDGEMICISNGSGTEYIVVSGYEGVDPNGDFAATPNLEQLSIRPNLMTWRNLGQVLAVRPEGQCTGIDKGSRYLISGAGFPAGGGLEERGEIHTR